MGLSGAPTMAGAGCAGSNAVSSVVSVPALRCPPYPRSQQTARNQHEFSSMGSVISLTHRASRKVSVCCCCLPYFLSEGGHLCGHHLGQR